MNKYSLKRKIKYLLYLSLSLFFRYSGLLFIRNLFREKNGLIVLMYHKINDLPNNTLSVSPAEFEEQIKTHQSQIIQLKKEYNKRISDQSIDIDEHLRNIEALKREIKRNEQIIKDRDQTIESKVKFIDQIQNSNNQQRMELENEIQTLKSDIMSLKAQTTAEQIARVFLEGVMKEELKGVQLFNQAIAILDEFGYLASWKATRDGPQVELKHCPYRELALDHPQLCQIDERILSELFEMDLRLIKRREFGKNPYTPCIFSFQTEGG